jgi:hypothetical protein
MLGIESSLCESRLWLGPNTDVDAWHFHWGDSEYGHKVTLRHSSAPVNKYILIVDGGKHVKIGTVPILQRSFRVAWTLDGGTSVCIECEGNVTSYSRRLIVNGDTVIPSLRKIMSSPQLVLPHVGRNAPVRVGITDFRIFCEGKEKVTVFQLFTEPCLKERAAAAKTVIVERRFSEFSVLDSIIRLVGIRSAFLSEKGIELPSKVYNPLTDQRSDDFLNTRRAALEKYLQLLLHHLDALMHMQEVYAFCGLCPLTGLASDPHYVPGAGLNTLTPSKLPKLVFDQNLGGLMKEAGEEDKQPAKAALM